jgi:Flp pilus assembly protein TadD
LSACGTFTAPSGDADTVQRLDHYDPVALNEFALAKVRDGDTGTAWILLERAARLAPHDERIARNLELLRAYRDGTLDRAAAQPALSAQPALRARPAVPEQAAGTAPSAGGTDRALSEPPPFWQAN